MPRSSSAVALVGGSLLLSAFALPDGTDSPDPDLYVSAGCASCHGATAAGAFGPTLAGTGLSFEAFLAQLRSPRGMMPPVTPGAVTDDQARRLFEYVSGLEEPEGGPVSGTGCPGGQHARGHHAQGPQSQGQRGAGADGCVHHRGGAAHQGQGRGGACRHGACSRRGEAAG